MATVEQTLIKVQRMLTGSMNLRAMTTKNGYQVQFTDISTAVHLDVYDWGADSEGEPRTLVEVWAVVLRNVKATPDVFEWVARNGGLAHFGALRAIDEDAPGNILLVLSHRLLGDYLDEPELQAAMWGVLSVADKWDDELQQRFGGQRWSES